LRVGPGKRSGRSSGTWDNILCKLGWKERGNKGKGRWGREKREQESLIQSREGLAGNFRDVRLEGKRGQQIREEDAPLGASCHSGVCNSQNHCEASNEGEGSESEGNAGASPPLSRNAKI